MFTEESRFYSDSSEGCSRVYRQDGKRYSDACVGNRRQFEGGRVTVWGGITAHDRTLLQIICGNLTGIRYRDEIMQRRVIPFIQKQQNIIVLQQDNTRLHVARVVRDFLPSRMSMSCLGQQFPNLSLKEHI